MFPVGALWGFRTRKELVDAGAACTVADPREVLALLDGRPK
jgi:phosphoglycolate phosphatase